MPTSLHHVKAEFFKTLGHPVRIRVLEFLSKSDHSVAEMLAAFDIEPSSLSQQLAVLRRSGLVAARREGSTVYYSLTSSQIAELLAVAKQLLATMLSDQMSLLSDLPGDVPSKGATGPKRGRARTQAG